MEGKEQAPSTGVQEDMIRCRTSLVVLTLVLLSGVPAGAVVQDPGAVVSRADRSLGEITELRAEFVQSVDNPILEKTTTGTGVLSYRAPDRFRIEYTDPGGDVIVDDGTFVWIYLPSAQPGQVIRQPAGEARLRNPLTYLRALRDEYLVRGAGMEVIEGRPSDHLRLEPLRPRTSFVGVDLGGRRIIKKLSQVRTRTAQDVVTTYTFRTLERNVDLDRELFRFRVPDGVEVFDP
jgi:outer membrane lipoprotein carrier protein